MRIRESDILHRLCCGFMKLITLNIWGGQVFEPLMQFVKKHARDTDIFCFQEVLFGPHTTFTPIHKARNNIFSEIEKLLPEFVALRYYAPEEALHFQSELLQGDTRAGQAIFVRKSFKVTDNGGFRSYQGAPPTGSEFGGKITGSCQWISLQASQTTDVTILNLHGLWQKDTNKVDTPARLLQSQVLQDFLNAKNNKTILCGDFNLIPHGESIKLLERGMVNLVKKFGVTSTRSNLYRKPEKFADYILVAPNVDVHRFEVLQDEVSDHLPLLLKFE